MADSKGTQQHYYKARQNEVCLQKIKYEITWEMTSDLSGQKLEHKGLTYGTVFEITRYFHSER
jgi:hypothetical protein